MKSEIPKCKECGAKRGMWHGDDCKFRLHFMPADEFICQKTGDEKAHKETFVRWSRISCDKSFGKYTQLTTRKQTTRTKL